MADDLGTRHQFHGVQPVLPVADATRAARYFCDVLGFELDFIAGEPPTSQPWGLREFALREPDGHLLRFCGYLPT